jgi:hypothetical protein
MSSIDIAARRRPGNFEATEGTESTEKTSSRFSKNILQLLPQTLALQ